MIIVNGEDFNKEEFHNGEVIFKKFPYFFGGGRQNIIELIFEDNRDITALIFAKKWLDKQSNVNPCQLVMKYCPYERMDREINQQMFSMRYFAKIIADLKFGKGYLEALHDELFE